MEASEVQHVGVREETAKVERGMGGDRERDGGMRERWRDEGEMEGQGREREERDKNAHTVERTLRWQVPCPFLYTDTSYSVDPRPRNA